MRWQRRDAHSDPGPPRRGGELGPLLGRGDLNVRRCQAGAQHVIGTELQGAWGLGDQSRCPCPRASCRGQPDTQGRVPAEADPAGVQMRVWL